MYRTVLYISLAVCLMVLGTASTAQSGGLPEQKIPLAFGVDINLTESNLNDVAQAADVGFRFMRVELSWPSIEKSPEVYDFTAYDSLKSMLNAKGIRPVFVLSCANPLYDDGLAPYTPDGREAFTAFTRAAAAYFKDKGAIWEIWDEPNASSWTPEPNAEDYVALVKETSAALKSTDPNAFVIGPGTFRIDHTFIEKCLYLGLLEHLDAVSVHPYRESSPETAVNDYRRLDSLIKRYQPKDRDIPIISSEWGYMTEEASEEQQAQYLTRMLLTNMLSNVKLSIWRGPKTSYDALQVLSSELDGCKFVSRIGEDGDQYVLLFNGPRGYRLAAWTARGVRRASIPIDVEVVTVVSTDGERTAASCTDGRLMVKLSQSPVYIEIGPSRRMALEEAVTFTTNVSTRWRLHDEVIAQISNPLPDQLRGTLTLTSTNQKPVVKNLKLDPGKTSMFKFEPDVIWDGQSTPRLDVSIDIEDFDAPLMRSVYLDDSHRISAVVACPLGRILEFRITSPGKHRVKGKIRLFDMVGLKVKETTKPFEVDTQTVVAFTLDEEPRGEYSFGYELIDATKRTIFRSRILNYAMVEDFSYMPEDAPLQDYEIVLEGDDNVAARVIAEAAKRGTPYVALSSIPVCKIYYDINTGHRFFRLVPQKKLPISVKPIQVGMWVYGDNSGAIVRCRFSDSTGQVFQPEGFPIDWQGWRYKTMPLDGTDSSWWGGAADGRLHPPLRWDTLFLFDTAGKEMKGVVYLGPVMLISEYNDMETSK